MITYYLTFKIKQAVNNKIENVVYEQMTREQNVHITSAAIDYSV